MPRRRGVLKKTALTVTATLTSGCIISDDAGDPGVRPEDRDRPCWENIDGERIDHEPFFDPEREDEMVFSEDDMHFLYEEYDDEDYPEYKAYIDTRDESNAVLFKINVHHTVDGAVERYEGYKDGFEESETLGVGDESARFVSSSEHAEGVLRKSNAVGHIISYVPEEAPEDPDERRTTPSGRILVFAEHLRDYWAGTSSYKNQPGFCREEVKELQQPDEAG